MRETSVGTMKDASSEDLALSSLRSVMRRISGRRSVENLCVKSLAVDPARRGDRSSPSRLPRPRTIPTPVARVPTTRNGWDDVFLDLDPERGIAAGQRWKEALQKAAWRCEVVLALVSKEWLASSWCKSEVDAARMMGKKVIAALVGIDKSEVPPDLTDEQFIDLTGDPDAYRRLKEGLKRAGLDPTSFPFEAGRRPYPGFAYLEEQDAAVFFGRDAQIVRGLDEIRRLARTGVTRMFVILGASGSGKSSFLRAGLWPRLKRDDLAWLPLPIVRPERAAMSGKYGLVEALYQAISEPRFADGIRQRGLPRSRADIQDFIEQDRRRARQTSRRSARNRAGGLVVR